jgi:hypothetical protein
VDYYKTFKAIRTVVDVHKGRAGFHEGIFKEKLKQTRKENGLDPSDVATDEMQEKAMSSSWDKYLGCLFISNADDPRFKELKKALDNAYLFGNDDYLTSIDNALRMMQNHKLTQTAKNSCHQRQIQSEGVTFA